MNTNNIKKITSSLVVGSSLVMSLVALPAYAQKVTASTTVSVKSQANQTQKLAALIAKTDQEITARITSLNTLSTKVQSLKNVSSTEKANISAEVQTEIGNLTTSKAKIDADTVLSVARTDAASAINTSRIYALIIPQGNIEVSVDRINVLVGLMNGIATKLQIRITAAQTAGKDVSALQSALSDITSQTTAASAQASTAETGVSGLVPDNGNKTILASNTAALKSARENIKTAAAALKTARQDVKTIINGLKAFHLDTSITASTTVSH